MKAFFIAYFVGAAIVRIKRIRRDPYLSMEQEMGLITFAVIEYSVMIALSYNYIA